MSAEVRLGTIVEVSVDAGSFVSLGQRLHAGKWIGIELYEPNGKTTALWLAFPTSHASQATVFSFAPVKSKPPLALRTMCVLRVPSYFNTQRTLQRPPAATVRPALGHQRTSSLRANSPTAPPPPVQAASPTKPRTLLAMPPRKSLQSASPPARNTDSPSRLNGSTPAINGPRVSSPLTMAPPHPPSPLSPQPPSSFQAPASKPPPAPLHLSIRVLEAKRADDARHVRELETRLADAETFVSLRPKLQAKLNSQQTELIATRRDLADAQQLAQLAEGRILDTHEQLEMAMLDKEVAEERAAAEAELEEVMERLAVVEVELGVLKEGGAPGGDEEDAGNKSMSAGKDSLAYIQLEKHNDRLKEALSDCGTYRGPQMQLDDALGAEEMLVQLTERNLMLGEKIEEMRITIEDLEALRELNDELEENHVETEKALTEDLVTSTASVRKRKSRQTESQTAASQSAAMMSLNLKLQSSASKNQAKNIELEIKRMEARETRELLNIVQPYLPQIYVETDSGRHKLLSHPRCAGRISALSTLCKRFAAVMRRCDVESFLNIGRLYQEIAPMEKRLDMHVDLLRRDEFREMECVSDVVKITAQFDHLAETYFSGFDYDLGERELGYLTSIATLVQDDETVWTWGGFDIDTELFEPLQRLLDQYKGAKALSKWRLEDLIQDSTALKAHLVPQVKALSNFVPELVNFGISFAQQIMPHLSDRAEFQSPFQLTTILSFVKQIAASTVAKDMKPGVTAWEAIGESITQLVQKVPENVIKVSGVSPWVTRVDEVKASVAVNLEAERRVAQLNEELQGLVRTLKQKSSTSRKRLEKWETVKRQADSIAEKDIVIADSKRLQGDLDVSEQERLKLKTLVGNEQRQASGTIVAEPENLPVEGSLETSHILDQIDALRGTVRYLRTENSYLKGQDLLREIEALPPLPEPISRIPTPHCIPRDCQIRTIPIRKTDRTRHRRCALLATETKILYRDVIKFSSSPRVVDLSASNASARRPMGPACGCPRKACPAHQVWERTMEAERLGRRVRGPLG
ncbi:dynactin [Mycena latifolia]|nr:dynactin [Mycena latifolia]